MDEFKFIVRLPRKLIDRDGSEQLFMIYTESPHYVYSVMLKKNASITTEEQYDLAVSKLKLKLIKDISNAEFELSKEP